MNNKGKFSGDVDRVREFYNDDELDDLFDKEMKEMERFSNEMELPLHYTEEEFFVDGKFVPVYPS